MRESEKRDVYNAAIEVLVARAVERKQPDNPDVYARCVRTDLGKRHYDRAVELFKAHGDLSADDLVTLLTPSKPAPEEPPNPTSAIPLVSDIPAFVPLEPQARTLARERIAECKQIIAQTPKVEIP